MQPNSPLAEERLAEIRRYNLSPSTTDLDMSDATGAIRNLLAEVQRLQTALRQVDDALTVGWIEHGGTDYTKALHDLVSREIQIHDDPAVSGVAKARAEELGRLRSNLKIATDVLKLIERGSPTEEPRVEEARLFTSGSRRSHWISATYARTALAAMKSDSSGGAR